MRPGDYVRTPRFGTVRIKEVCMGREEAADSGYTEPTHYDDPEYEVVGKSLDAQHMLFAAFKK